MNFYRFGSRTALAALPGGIEGIKTTMRLMRSLVQRWKRPGMGIRELAGELTDPLPQQDYAGEVRVLHAFVRDQIRYVGDVSELETLHTPRAILELGRGDCDDKSVLLATLLESINHKTRFVAGAFEPGMFSHVWVETLLGSSWYPLETTKPVPAGWSPPGVLERMVAHN